MPSARPMRSSFVVESSKSLLLIATIVSADPTAPSVSSSGRVAGLLPSTTKITASASAIAALADQRIDSCNA